MGSRRTNSRASGGRALRRLALGLVLGGLLLLGEPGRAAGAGEGVGDILAVPFDLVVLRPLSATALVLGAGCFALSAPFVYPFEGIDTAWDVFVYAPFEYTFLRQLGSF